MLHIREQSWLKKTLVAGVALLALSACQTFEKPSNNDETTKTLKERSLSQSVVRPPIPPESTRLGDPSSPVDAVQPNDQAGQIIPLQTVPTLANPTIDEQIDNIFRPRLGAVTVDTFVRPLPIPEFIDVVFGGILEQPYVTGPGVSQMMEVVQLRSSGEMRADVFLELVSGALENYGVRVVPEDGAFQIIQDEALRQRIPRFIKSRARLSTKDDLRPVVQFIELQAIGVGPMREILSQAFGQSNDRIVVDGQSRSNIISIAGYPEDVDQAVAIILQMDDLNFAGSRVKRYSPRYWRAEDFAEELSELLALEGWQVSDSSRDVRTISLMPVEYTNDVFIFTQNDQALERTEYWVRQLDRPVSGGDTEEIFIYQVRNVDAQILADTANAVITGGRRAAIAPPLPDGPEGAAAVPTQGAGLVSSRGGNKFTVDPLGNRIIISSTANEYSRLATLLERLDTPAPEVLIEVQIAEVTLTDSTSSGVEFLLNNLGDVSIQTTGLGVGASGVNVSVANNDLQARLNALASNRRVKLLSTPVLVARSGGSAEIQVGTDVPIITSQAAANTQSGDGTLDILQQVTYRSTGVLLSIEPIVFSDYRVDLAVSQEVSSTIDATNTSISSPSISSRTITTELSLEDGETAVLGGLIQENVVRDDQGIPFLKDIPAIGQAFSNDSYSVDRTELVVLITAYVLRGQADKTRFVQALSRSVNQYLDDSTRPVTLNPIVSGDD